MDQASNRTGCRVCSSGFSAATLAAGWGSPSRGGWWSATAGPCERGAGVAVARIRAPGQIDDAAHVGPGVRAYRDASRVRICAAAPDHEVVRAHRVARAGVARHVQVVQPVEDGLADVESAVR